MVDGGLVGEDYTQRGRVNCTDTLDISLQLTEVVEEDHRAPHRAQPRCDVSHTHARTNTVVL